MGIPGLGAEDKEVHDLHDYYPYAEDPCHSQLSTLVVTSYWLVDGVVGVNGVVKLKREKPGRRAADDDIIQRSSFSTL